MTPSLPSRLPCEPHAVEPDDGGTVLVEARSAAEALAEVTSRLGADAQIVGAAKVTRGGIGGFFARELVQLRAQSPHPGGDDGTAAGVPATGAVEAGSGGAALARILEQLSSDVDAQERTFADALRGQLATVDAALPAPTATDAPARPGAPAWSRRNLRRLGLPAAVVDVAEGCDAGDDLAWVRAVADAVAPLCRPLPPTRLRARRGRRPGRPRRRRPDAARPAAEAPVTGDRRRG